MTENNNYDSQSRDRNKSHEPVRLDEARSYNHKNTAKDSSAERPRLWKDVQKPKPETNNKK